MIINWGWQYTHSAIADATDKMSQRAELEFIGISVSES